MECPLCAKSGHRNALFGNLAGAGEQGLGHRQASALLSATSRDYRPSIRPALSRSRLKRRASAPLLQR